MTALSPPPTNFRPLTSPPRSLPTSPRVIPPVYSLSQPHASPTKPAAARPVSVSRTSPAASTTSPAASRTYRRVSAAGVGASRDAPATRSPASGSSSSRASESTGTPVRASSAATPLEAGEEGEAGKRETRIVPADNVEQATPRKASSSAAATATSVERKKHMGREEALLPPGMNVQEALARCEDPGLSWSLQFWVTIADPVSQHVFFACPASGQASWDPPVGAFVVPRSPQGEWWELADPSRGNRSYYYNTLTGETQWPRPEGDAFVIPLGLIQRNALPQHPGRAAESTKVSRSSSKPKLDTTRAGPPLNSPTAPATPRRDRASVAHVASPLSASPATPSRSGATPAPTRVKPSPRMSTVPVRFSSLLVHAGPQPSRDTAETKAEIAVEDAKDRGWWDRRKTVVKSIASPRGKAADRQAEPKVLRAGNEPVPTQMSVQTKRLSTGPHPLLRPELTTEIQAFKSDDFSSRYFATRRAGVLRQRVPLEKILEWQRAPVSQPLLVLSKTSARDALATFKVIQHVMGERDRPVEGARAASSTVARVRDPTAPGEAREKTAVLEEIRWMVQLGVTRGEMRDEIYCQLIKQLTKNPDKEANVLGFQLFCVLVAAFVPSKNFEGFVKTFLRRDHKAGLGVMAQYCLRKIDGMIANGGRGRVLTLGEIEHASDAAFYPSVYGQSLETVLRLQQPSYPDLKVPIILPFLADGILALGGTHAEGIFRVPGDGDSVGELKARIDRGHYQLTGIDDPHVVASLFKLWLRELEHPLVPADTYDAALAAAALTDADGAAAARACADIVRALPDAHRRALLFVISFLQLFLAPHVVERTRMGAHNLALVLAPNILRSPSDHLETAFTNSNFESRFVLNLLLHLNPRAVDDAYRPEHGAVQADLGGKGR
ncbi:hypothetical protein Q5752_001467 [Cryptotrichosporon argae]